ncbi:MAG: hypothetical protein L0228_06350 [Planctomycetes bacterium]|nr:hypothetical protein [Planctomycetota bacterium]
MLATITVNSLLDNGDGANTTFREAAAAAMSGDTIVFSVTGTIDLTNNGTGHVRLGTDLTLQGPGANLLTIKAFDPTPNVNNSDGRRVLLVGNSVGSSVINVTISGLTISGGDPQLIDENTAGGGIRNMENLTIVDCVITDNFTFNGGAISNHAGTLTIIDSKISGNTAHDGGGILVEAGSVNITRTRFEGNYASNVGGAIINRGFPVTITDSTFTENGAGDPETPLEFNGAGGAIATYDGSLSITGSTITGNSVGNQGGGIFNHNSTVTITNSTIGGNSADEQGGGFYSHYLSGASVTISQSTISGNSADEGGGVSAGGSITIASSTISGNSASTRGGGIFNSSGTTVVRYSTITANAAPPNFGSGIASRGVGSTTTAVRSSIVAGNTNSDVNFVGGATNSFQSDGYNVIGTGNAMVEFVETGDQANVANPMLGALADNGGPTLTHLPLMASPAINAGDPAAMAGVGNVPSFDQRGNPHDRILGVRIDIGAIEMPPPPPVPELPGDYNLDNIVDGADCVVWRKTYGSSVPQYSGADGNGDSLVNQEDYDVWRANFGNTPTGAGASLFDEAALSGDETSAAESNDSTLAVHEKQAATSAAAIAWYDDSPSVYSPAAAKVLHRLPTSVSDISRDMLHVVESSESWSNGAQNVEFDRMAHDNAIDNSLNVDAHFTAISDELAFEWHRW